MYHSITFGDKNTWTDWHLIPSSRPAISMPSTRPKFVEIPGMNGSLDLSDILTGFPTFGDRSGSISFYVVNDYWPWQVAYETISNYLHGQRMRMILEDDPAYYYEGRFKVDSWQTGADRSTITIGYTVGPFKIAVNSSSEPWLWDPFSFETGVIRNYRQIAIDGETSIDIDGRGQPVSPTLTVTGSLTMSVTRNGETTTFSLVEGTYQAYGFYIYEGPNHITFSGSGTVTIDYREESL